MMNFQWDGSFDGATGQQFDFIRLRFLRTPAGAVTIPARNVVRKGPFGHFMLIYNKISDTSSCGCRFFDRMNRIMPQTHIDEHGQKNKPLAEAQSSKRED